jgi:hypothetical protein
MPVLHKRIYGSVEALEGEERLQRNRRFRIEASTAASPEVRLHCNDNFVYVFLFWEWRGLIPKIPHSCVCERYMYVPRICPHISSSRKGRPIVGIYNSLSDT